MRIVTAASLALSLAACASTSGTVAEREPEDPQILWEAQRLAVERMMRNFHRVHFEFDSAVLEPDSRQALAENVDIMRLFPAIGLEVEGHCDTAGSQEYNLALGQRRADAIAKYMTTAGVERERITTISYGEEVPLAWGDDEPANRENRRAEFRISLGSHPLIRGTVEDAFAFVQR